MCVARCNIYPTVYSFIIVEYGSGSQNFCAFLVELKTGPLKAQIARLQGQAKPQPKPKPQPGVATLHKQTATLKEENRALAAKVTKIASLKRARTMQHDRRSRFRDKDNDQENTESPAEKKRDTRNSSSSTTVDNK